MQNGQIPLGCPKLVWGEDIAVLQADIVILIEKPLPLHPGHVEDVQLGHSLLQRSGLLIVNAVFLQQVGTHTLRHTELLRGNEHKTNIRIPGHRTNQGMDRPAKFQVTAAANHQRIQSSLLPFDGQQIRQGLRGVVMSPVTGIDHRNRSLHGRHQRRTLLGMAHGYDIRKAAYRPRGIRHTFSLGGGRALGLMEPQHLSPQFIHG